MATAKRDKKVDTTPSFTTLMEADAALARLHQVNTTIAAVEQKAAEEKARIDRDQAEATKDLYADQKMLARELELFARHHFERGGFDGRKSLELPSGFIGFRQSTKTSWLFRKVDDVVGAIRAAAKAKTKLGQLVAERFGELVKVKETPVKTAIRTLTITDRGVERRLTADELALLGTKVETDEMVFAYSTDKSKAFDLSATDDAEAA